MLHMHLSGKVTRAYHMMMLYLSCASLVAQWQHANRLRRDEATSQAMASYL